VARRQGQFEAAERGLFGLQLVAQSDVFGAQFVEISPAIDSSGWASAPLFLTIDQLNARLEQSRAQCRRLDAECENYFRMLQAG
jgi:hypothetical protein